MFFAIRHRTITISISQNKRLLLNGNNKDESCRVFLLRWKLLRELSVEKYAMTKKACEK